NFFENYKLLLTNIKLFHPYSFIMSPLRSQQIGRNYCLEQETEIVHNSDRKKRNLIIVRPFSSKTTCHHHRRRRHGYSCYLNNNNRRHKEQLKQHNCFKNNDEDQSDEYLKILSERINRIEKLINDLSDKVNSTSPQPLTINGTQVSNSDQRLQLTINLSLVITQNIMNEFRIKKIV
ncbi:7353_t:CDS:2, partial [Entrophospora sp. SA101]